jgi:hypothetical protein
MPGNRPDFVLPSFLFQVFLKLDKECFREDTESKELVEEGLQNG